MFLCIDNNDALSSMIKSGVLLGSILGPFFFLLYIKDLHGSSNILKFIHFSDGTAVFHSHTNIEKLLYPITSKLSNIWEWLVVNCLSINIEKQPI